MNRIAGIDYGSKLAGTTAIAFFMGNQIHVLQSKKKEDADQFLQKVIEEQQLDTLFIDAPLSLPNAYFGKGTDFFYRACDRQLRAMSPMFLGGLTARAMKLQDGLRPKGVTCFETYPGHTAQRLGLIDSGYKKEKENILVVLEVLKAALPNNQLPIVDNWHAVDALLALIAAVRYHDQSHESVGDPDEGSIYF